jgi:hypothetical protein
MSGNGGDSAANYCGAARQQIPLQQTPSFTTVYAYLLEQDGRIETCHHPAGVIGASVQRLNDRGKRLSVAEFTRNLVECGDFLWKICVRVGTKVVRLHYGDGLVTTVLIKNDALKEKLSEIKVSLCMADLLRLVPTESIWDHVLFRTHNAMTVPVSVFIRTGGAIPIALPSMSPDEIDLRRTVLAWPRSEGDPLNVERIVDISDNQFHYVKDILFLIGVIAREERRREERARKNAGKAARAARRNARKAAEEPPVIEGKKLTNEELDALATAFLEDEKEDAAPTEPATFQQKKRKISNSTQSI